MTRTNTTRALLAGLLAFGSVGCGGDGEPARGTATETPRVTGAQPMTSGDERARTEPTLDATAASRTSQMASANETATEPRAGTSAGSAEPPSADLQQRYADEEGVLYSVGEVTYYSDAFAGRQTASGDVYDPSAMTAATDQDLPMGTIVRVERIGTDRSVVVRINDRMDPDNEDDRVLDLSRAAAEELGIVERGVTEARIVVLERPGRGRSASR